MAYTKNEALSDIAALARETDDVADILSFEDIAGLPDEAVGNLLGDRAERIPTGEEMLRRAHMKLGASPPPSDPAFEHDPDPAKEPHQRKRFIVPRLLAETVWESLDTHPALVIFGAHGSGKSTLWRAQLRGSAQFRRRFDAAVTLDAFSLRSPSPRIVAQDALYAQFAEESDFYAFLTAEARFGAGVAAKTPSSGGRSPGHALWDFLKMKFAVHEGRARLRGLVVFDHVEHLSKAPDVVRWLADLIDRLCEAGLKVLILHTGKVHPSYSAVLKGCPALALNPIDAGEIEAWWREETFAPYRRRSLNAQAVLALTGGSPRLVRDFGRFLETRGDALNGSWVESFRELMTREFLPEVARLLEAAFEHPHLLSEPLEARRPAVRAQFLATGAMVERGGRLSFISPIYEERYRALAQERGVSMLLMDGTDERLLNVMKAKKALGRQFAMNLMQDVQPANVWARAARAFATMGLGDVEVLVRDPGNAKIWLRAYSEEPGKQHWKAIPLHAAEMPDEARAIKSGRIVEGEDARVVLPFSGESGRIAVIVRGRVSLSFIEADTFERRLRLRFLWNLALAIRPAIALAAERALQRRQERHWRRIAYRTTRPGADAGADQPSVLLQAGCSAIMVLERGMIGWDVIDAESVDGASGYMNWRQRFAGARHTMLDNIVEHPSGRGLVLDGEDLTDAFPRLRYSEISSVFVYPQAQSGLRGPRLVIFAFGSEEDGKIVGERQIHLSMIACQASEAC